MECPKCKFSNPEGMNFCGRCGEKLTSFEPPTSSKEPERSRICVDCGKEFAWYANLCPYCGRYYGSMCLPRASRQPTWKPIIGGILCIIVSSMIILSMFGFGFIFYSNYPYYYYYGLTFLLALGLSPVAMAGGISAIARKYWAFSLAGSICAVVMSVLMFSTMYIIMSVIGVILIAASQGEYRKR